MHLSRALLRPPMRGALVARACPAPRCAAPGRRALCVSAGALSEPHAAYLTQVAGVEPPRLLEAFVKTLNALGSAPTAPGDRTGLHPFMVPVAASEDGSTVTGLLRWPDVQNHAGMELPVVQMARGDTKVKLLARNVDDYVKRQLLEEDKVSGPSAVYVAVGPTEAEKLYKPGSLEESTLPTYEAFVVRNVGMYPDTNEQLSHNHAAKGDMVSAMVAAEWAMKKDFFPGWGRAFEFAAEVYRSNARPEEMRDMARVSLRLPWWTLQNDYQEVLELAQLEGLTATEIRDGLNQEESLKAQDGTTVKPEYAVKSPEQEALEESYFLLNQVVAGERESYADVADEVSAKLLAAKLEDAATFVATY